MKNKTKVLIAIFTIILLFGMRQVYIMYKLNYPKSNAIDEKTPSNDTPKKEIMKNNYVTEIFKDRILHEDYYFTQINNLVELTKIEYDNEKMNAENSKKYNTDDPYFINFYSDKKEILDVSVFPFDKTLNYSEAIAVALLLNYYGIKVSVDEIKNNYLKPSEITLNHGKFMGSNPTENCMKFDNHNYSNCFALALDRVVTDILKEKKLTQTLIGMNLNYMLPNFPVIVWVGEDYQEATEVYEWYDKDTNKLHTFPKKSTAILMVGYDQTNFYIIDPMKSEDVISVDRLTLEKSYNSYGRQALAIYEGRNGLFK